MKSETKIVGLSNDEQIIFDVIEKQVNERYKIPLPHRISNLFSSITQFALILFLIPFLTLIKLFQIVFNRE